MTGNWDVVTLMPLIWFTMSYFVFVNKCTDDANYKYKSIKAPAGGKTILSLALYFLTFNFRDVSL